MNLTAPCRHASCAKSAPPWRSAMPAPGLPNGGMRTWAGGATESPVANLEAPPDLILHAVRRMTFGHTDEEYNRAAQMGFPAYVMEQTIPHILDDSACEAVMASLGHETQGLGLAQLWPYRNFSFPRQYYPLDEVIEETHIRQVHSRRQLFEVMVDFWHNHFNVRAGSFPIFAVWRSYDRDVIRQFAMKNFRVLLEWVGSHTAMLYYLDNYLSTSGGPNENYARELFELHAMGAEHYLVPGGYSDEDVYEAARCFTGWSVNNSNSTGNNGTFLYKEQNHDRFQKRVLGYDIARDNPPLADGRIVYDLLASHPLVHRHIARKLCQRFIADDPPASIIDSTAAVFGTHVAHEWQITITLQHIFNSTEFANSWHGKVRRPVDFLMAAIRAMGGTFRWNDDWEWNTGPLNQELFNWPTPDGYPDDAASWIGTNGMLYRWNIVSDMAVGSIQAVSVDLRAQTPAELVTPNQLVDFWIHRTLRHAVTPHVRQALVEFVAEGRNPDLALPSSTRNAKIPSLVALILSSPEFQYR